VCLIATLTAEDIGAAPASNNNLGCMGEFSGFVSPDSTKERPLQTQLYAHVHAPCEGGEVSYHGYVWFWVAGKYATKNEPMEKISRPYHCGDEPVVDLIEAFLLVAEFYPDTP
jgi:hypothetical protein